MIWRKARVWCAGEWGHAMPAWPLPLNPHNESVCMPFGQINHVRKVFTAPASGGAAGAEVVALDDASFSFEQGECVALLGPSGCGKTTLLRIVAGLSRPSSGEVTVAGRQVNGPYPDYGFVFQSPSLMPWRNVLDNVLFPMQVLHRCDATARQRAHDLLALVGLAEFEGVRPHQLSGGMQQRVALCRALVHAPRLLLMDEPFAALDELTRLDMNDLLLRVRQQTDAAVLFVTHSIAEAVYLADKVLVFSGRPARVTQEIHPGLGSPRQREMRFSAAFSEVQRLAGEALGVITPQAGLTPELAARAEGVA